MRQRENKAGIALRMFWTDCCRLALILRCQEPSRLIRSEQQVPDLPRHMIARKGTAHGKYPIRKIPRKSQQGTARTDGKGAGGCCAEGRENRRPQIFHTRNALD